MVILDEKGILLEIKKCGLNDLKAMLEHSPQNKEWPLLDFLKPSSGEQERAKEAKYVVWVMNKRHVGYTSLERVGAENAAGLHFHLVEAESATEDIWEHFVKASAEMGFQDYFLKSLLFCSKENSEFLSEIFLKAFRPHSVGWVHLDDQKYVLTRGQYTQTEKEFYRT